MIDDSGNEDVLKEVRNILELASSETYLLSNEQMKELDVLEEQYRAGKIKTYSWEEVKQGLIDKLKK